MKLYYSIVDAYPAFRVDLAELFGVELRKLGLQTEWFMRSGEKVQVGKAESYAGQRINLAPALWRWPGPVRRAAYWVSDAVGLLRQVLRRPDALQCRDKYLASLVGLGVARLMGRPFFYWCSYPFPEHAALSAQQCGGLRRLLLLLKAKVQFWLLYRFICRHADHVFVQSEQMLADMASYGVRTERMTPVPMGVSARMEQWVESHRVAVVPGRFVYLGTLASVRRLEMLVEAFALVAAQLPEAELLFVGDGDVPRERAELQACVERMGLARRVRFTGFIPMEEAWNFAASAAVCLSPFYPAQVLRSTSPTKLVEYLALGRPVVCNDHPEQSRIMAECGAGLCVEWAASAFADAMLQLACDPDDAERRGRLGPPWVRTHRTYPIIAQRLWRVYQRLVGRT